jgi:excisionase family DNA binding protein
MAEMNLKLWAKLRKERQLLEVSTISNLLGISESSVKRLIYDGKLKATQIRTKWYIFRDSAEKLIKN